MKLNTEKMIGEKEGGIGWMTFNNPARRNAMSLDMWQGVETILDEFESDDDIKVIVMRGAGDKAFVSGADISEFKERRNNAEAAAEYARISEGARARLMSVKKPLIAMIQGYCLGGGMAVAMAADMRFATEDSQFGIPAARLSIAYGYDGLHKLVHLVGPAMASEIMFTARRVQPDEAQRIGLINRAVPVDELEARVREVADAICRNAPLSIAASKHTIGQILTDKEDRDYDEIKRMSKMCFDMVKGGREAFMENAPRIQRHLVESREGSGSRLAAVQRMCTCPVTAARRRGLMLSYVVGWGRRDGLFCHLVGEQPLRLGTAVPRGTQSALFRRRSDCPKAEIARLARPKAFYFHRPTLDAGLAGAIDERADHAVLRAMMLGNLHAFALALR